MRITRLSIENLRNLGSVSIEPSSTLNVFYGDNGAGKTSVLEALYLLAKGRSFRGGAVAALIGAADSPIRVVTEFEDGAGQAHRIGIERDRDGWRGRMDGAELKQVSDTARHFPIMLMEPNSHRLVSGSPDERRRYLDWSVFHVKPGFLAHWRGYARALKQRNAALRTGDRVLVQSLDEPVIRLGMLLHEERAVVLEGLRSAAREMLALMSPELGAGNVVFNTGWKGDSLREALEHDIERDLEQGFTRSGPHRADLLLRVGDRAVRDRLSRGEQKVLAASLLLAQARLFARHGRKPLVLLDDLASEFDDGHLRRVVEHSLSLDAQVWVTGTSADAFGSGGVEQARLFHVKQGEIGLQQAAERPFSTA